MHIHVLFIGSYHIVQHYITSNLLPSDTNSPNQKPKLGIAFEFIIGPLACSLSYSHTVICIMLGNELRSNALEANYTRSNVHLDFIVKVADFR